MYAVSKELVRTDSFSLTNLLCRDEISTRTQFYLSRFGTDQKLNILIFADLPFSELQKGLQKNI